MPKKLPQQNPAKSVFSFWIMEDEQGIVTIRSDYVGQGQNSFYIGMSVLNNLKQYAHFVEDVNVEPIMLASYHQ
jgi:hypothetical protein